jgi:hypothetical protein
MSLDKSRTGSDLIDTSCLLNSEKDFFEALQKVLDGYRSNVLLKVLNVQALEKVEESKEIEKTVEEPKVEKTEVSKEEKSTKFLRFKHAVPKFVGTEGEEFGPFEEEDMASLPTQIADVLIGKDRVEEIKEE